VSVGSVIRHGDRWRWSLRTPDETVCGFCDSSEAAWTRVFEEMRKSR